MYLSKDEKWKILLLDDFPPTVAAVRLVLESYKDVEVVAEAKEVQEALRFVAGHHLHVVIVGLNMPGMNAIQVAKHLKNRWLETVIVGISLMNDPYMTKAFLKAETAAVVPKSEIFTELYPTIKRACSSLYALG